MNIVHFEKQELVPINTVVTSRQAILSAAKEIARTQGLQALTIRGVAAACGVAVGSVYNYFPSKADLTAAVVEEIWKESFHLTGADTGYRDFPGCVLWLFESIRSGTKEYAGFFTAHSMAFAGAEKETGRLLMDRSFAHIKKGLATALQNDPHVKVRVFTDSFSQADFLDFVFSNIVALLTKGEPSCGTLAEVVKRVLY